MGVKRTGYAAPKLPGYVVEWVGKEVLAPTAADPRKGRVTSVARKRVGNETCIYAHVAIHDGPLVIVPVKALLVLANRPTEPEKCDELSQVFNV